MDVEQGIDGSIVLSSDDFGALEQITVYRTGEIDVSGRLGHKGNPYTRNDSNWNNTQLSVAWDRPGVPDGD
ncbi:hypothetical protein FACS189475_04010 [Betaproteobacteria bacterium]|nr:hypothetical protein FACS189475_04010 [Betaproteobacteria bacterium]